MIINYLILTVMILTGCGGQLEFGDSQFSSMSEKRGHAGATAENSGDPDQVPEEDIQAEMPAIISGSFLSCHPDAAASSGSQSILNCFPEASQDLPSVKAGSTFESIIGQQTIVFSVLAVHRDADSLTPFLQLSANLKFSEFIKLADQFDPVSPAVLSKKTAPTTEPVKKEIAADPEPEPEPEPEQTETQPSTPEEPVAGDPVSKTPEPVVEEPKVEIVELIENGSFEADEPATAFGAGGFWGLFPDITGWSLESGSDIEIQKTLLNVPAADGDQWVELCSTGDSRIAQTVTTESGKDYQVSYYVSARPGSPAGANSFLLFINGTRVKDDTLLPQPLADHTWTKVTHVFSATGPESVISFSSNGCAGGSSGAWIDNISVKIVAP